MNNTTYYLKNGMLNIATDYYEDDKKISREQARDKYKIYLKKIKIKRENMEEKHTIICLKKKNKD